MTIHLIIDGVKGFCADVAKSKTGVWLGRVVTTTFTKANVIPVAIVIIVAVGIIICYKCYNRIITPEVPNDLPKNPKKVRKRPEETEEPGSSPKPLPGVEIPKNDDVKKPTPLKIDPISVPEIPQVKNRTIDDIVLGSNEETLEADVVVVYDYINAICNPSGDDFNKCFSLSLTILEKLDFSKINRNQDKENDPLYWLVFGRCKKAQFKNYLKT
jgi:hypothetical protein